MIVQIPDDIYAYDSKVIGNLTKRQAVCFSLAFLVVVAVFVPIMLLVNTTLAAMVAFCMAVPVFMCAVIKKDGQPFEKVMKYRMMWNKREKKRPYRAGNFYDEIVSLGDIIAKEADIDEKDQKGRPVRRRKVAQKKR